MESIDEVCTQVENGVQEIKEGQPDAISPLWDEISLQACSTLLGMADVLDAARAEIEAGRDLLNNGIGSQAMMMNDKAENGGAMITDAIQGSGRETADALRESVAHLMSEGNEQEQSILTALAMLDKVKVVLGPLAMLKETIEAAQASVSAGKGSADRVQGAAQNVESSAEKFIGSFR